MSGPPTSLFRRRAGDPDIDDVIRVPGAACNDALGVDRVALLFLTMKAMHHEAVWRRWLHDAAGVLPAQARQARTAFVWQGQGVQEGLGKGFV